MSVKRVINLPHTTPPSRITFETRFDEVLAALNDASERCIAEVGQQVVTDARSTGDYQNRTGDARRLITSNSDHALDDPKSYPATEVRVVEADGEERTRKQHHPPSNFDDTTVVKIQDGVMVRVAAIVPYASALEAKGYSVLTKSVDKVVANATAVLNQTFKLKATRIKNG